MIISSELTGKTYKTVEECLEAEKTFREEERRKREARRAKAKELDEAYKEAIAACKKYLNLTGTDFELLDEYPWITCTTPIEPFSVIKDLLGIEDDK